MAGALGCSISGPGPTGFAWCEAPDAEVRDDEEALITAQGGQLQPIATRRELHITPAGMLQPFTWVVLPHPGER